MVSLRRCYLFLIILLASCNHEDNQTQKSIAVQYVDSVDLSKFVVEPDTSNQFIYDFMKTISSTEPNIVFSDVPHVCPDLVTDSYLINMLLYVDNYSTADTSKLSGPNSYRVIITPKQMPSQCLTREDIDTMILQSKKLSGFRWNAFRLGLSAYKPFDIPVFDPDLQNAASYYYSVPLFSKDKTKAIISSYGGVSLYRIINGRWIRIDLQGPPVIWIS